MHARSCDWFGAKCFAASILRPSFAGLTVSCSVRFVEVLSSRAAISHLQVISEAAIAASCKLGVSLACLHAKFLTCHEMQVTKV